jgi:NADPH2:quinone reductase
LWRALRRYIRSTNKHEVRQMRAAWYEKNGAATDVLHVGEVETPKPGPGEVRIKLKTSGVNPSDVKNRAGTTRKIAYPRVIPQSDGAGVIDMVGEGVPASRVGERVWTWNGQWKRPFGTAAEYIVLPQEQAVHLPDAVSFEAGACLGIPALTAWHAVDIAGTTNGTTLLIAGGAGAVAHYAIQFAKARGATVITTVSSDAKAKVARDAGADHTINYKTENVGERVAALTKGGVDAVIELDLTANAALVPVVLRPRGTLVVYGTGPQVQFPGSFCLVNNVTVKFLLVYELTAEAVARHCRHSAQAGSEHAGPQCRGDVSARRGRCGPSGGRERQGCRQRRDAGRIDRLVHCAAIRAGSSSSVAVGRWPPESHVCRRSR